MTNLDDDLIEKLLSLCLGDVDFLMEAMKACSKEEYVKDHWWSKPRLRWACDLQDVVKYVVKAMRENDESNSSLKSNQNIN